MNYFYAKATGNSNLWNHLTKRHAIAYNNAIIDNGWSYKLSMHSDNVAYNNTCNDVTNQLVPPFSPKAFLDNLVHFIIADD